RGDHGRTQRPVRVRVLSKVQFPLCRAAKHQSASKISRHGSASSGKLFNGYYNRARLRPRLTWSSEFRLQAASVPHITPPLPSKLISSSLRLPQTPNIIAIDEFDFFLVPN